MIWSIKPVYSRKCYAEFDDTKHTQSRYKIVDVFDALTSARAYKKARPVEYAIELIKSERGKHFDPKVVDSFLNVLPKIIAVKEKYADILENRE